MKTAFDSVDQYLDAQPETARLVLVQVRQAIRAAIPKAEECISYNIPTYKLNHKAVIYFAGWKKHYSIYPASSNLVASLQSELAPYEIKKGTIKFPLNNPAPIRLIKTIAKLRAAESTEPQR